ncbi:DUF4241 domain-containing protein [Risungbinella massiliensis]
MYCQHFGWGDGSYPTYWGLDEQGEAVVRTESRIDSF